MTATPAKKSSKKSKAVEAPVVAESINGSSALSKQAPPFRNRIIV
jgi:hypothetical protein